MAITRYAAQRFSGLEEDVNNLPIDADLLGAIFNSTDTLKFFIFDGTTWNESAGGGGITGLEPNSTILEYTTDILDYTTPTSATATSPTPVPPVTLAEQGISNSGSSLSSTNNTRAGELITATGALVGVAANKITFNGNPTGSPTGTGTFLVRNSIDTIVHTFGTIDVSTISGDFSVTGPTYTFQADDRLLFEYSGGDGSNLINFLFQGGGSTYDGADSILTFFDGTYTDTTNADARFKVEIVFANGPEDAIDGNTATFWQSDAGINESITLDMGQLVNAYGLAYFISTAELAAMTETQFQIKLPDTGDTDFEDDYNSNVGWTQVGTGTTVDDGSFPDIMKCNNVVLNADSRVHKSLGLTLSDTQWISNFEFELTSIAATRRSMIIVFSAGTNNLVSGTDMDYIGVRWNVFGGSGATIVGKEGTVLGTESAFVTLSTGVQYFGTFRRTSTTQVDLAVFTDVNRTIQVGSTVTATIAAGTTGLDTIQHGTDQAGTGSDFVTLQVDNTQLFNNTNVVPPLIPGQLIRTLNTTELTPDVFNFIRFNGINTQFITVEGSSGSSLVMAANELAVQIESDPPLTTLHGQFTIPTIAGTPLNGGDPTSSVIADPQINTFTFNNVSEPSDPALDESVTWHETLDANNDVTHTKMKIDGAIKNVRWF